MRRAAPWLVVLTVFLAYLPAVKGRFVDWDDYAQLVAAAPHWGRGLRSLGWIFGTFTLPQYIPVTWLAFALDKAVWGLSPTGFHLTNNAIHAANAGIFYGLALELLGGSPLAAAAAALFWALHPMRVEGVAWIFERSTALSGLFSLLTIRYYLRARRRAARRRSLAIALSLFVASLLSKAGGITLPATLLALDFYRGRWADPRERRRALLDCLPFVVVAVPFAALAYALQYLHKDLMWPMRNFGPGYRLGQSAYALAFYLWKTIVPVKMLAIYVAPRRLPWGPVALAALVVSALAALGVLWRKRRPWLLACEVHYAAGLLPTIGLVKIGAQIAADRYYYLPSLSWALLAGAAAAAAAKRWRAEVIGLCAAILLGLTALTWRQFEVWSGGDSVWTTLAAADPGNPLALEHLAIESTLRGRLDDAREMLEASLRSDPDFGAAHSALGTVLARQGRFDDAVAQYREALRCSGEHPTIHYNLGLVLERQGKRAEAAEQYRDELSIVPGHEASAAALARVSGR